MKLAELLFKIQKYDEAQKELKKILIQDPANLWARLTLGLIYHFQKQYDMAIEAFSDLAKRYPEDYRIRFLLGSTYEEMQAYDDAIGEFLLIGEDSEFYEGAQIHLAIILKEKGQNEQAIASLKEAIGKKKNAARLHLLLSSLYAEKKDFPAAEGILKSGIINDPQNADMHYSLGALYEKMGRFQESVDEMEMVLKIEPDYAEALNFIGYSYAERNINLDKAEDMIKRALELKPGNGYILDSMGWVYFKQNKLEMALKYLKQALDLIPEEPTIAEHLGDVYRKMGRIKEAVEAYKKAMKFNPTNEILQKNIKELLKKRTP
jgi:tetratricopeptide (TPR) repeat protein